MLGEWQMRELLDGHLGDRVQGQPTLTLFLQGSSGEQHPAPAELERTWPTLCFFCPPVLSQHFFSHPDSKESHFSKSQGHGTKLVWVHKLLYLSAFPTHGQEWRPLVIRVGYLLGDMFD